MHALTVIGIALGVMFRIISPKKGLSKLGAMVLGILFIPFVIQFAEALWKGLPFVYQLTALVVVLPTLFLLLTRVFFGKEVYHELLGHILYGLFTSVMNVLFAIATSLGRALFWLFALGLSQMGRLWTQWRASGRLAD